MRLAVSLGNLAESYRNQDKYEQAEPLYKRSLAILESGLGMDHPTIVEILQNYAGLMHKMKRPADAERLEERAKTIRAKNPQ